MTVEKEKLGLSSKPGKKEKRTEKFHRQTSFMSVPRNTMIQVINQIVCKQLRNSKKINNSQHGFLRNRLQTNFFSMVAWQVLWLEEKTYMIYILAFADLLTLSDDSFVTELGATWEPQ